MEPDDYRSRWEQFTDSKWHTIAVAVAGLLVVAMCVVGCVATAKKTNGPGYEPRVSYQIGELR